MDTFITPTRSTHDGRSPLIAILVTFVATIALLLGIVLPAVYGINPFAVGSGHLKAAEKPPAPTPSPTELPASVTEPAPDKVPGSGPLFTQTTVAKSDARTFDIAPLGSVEFGYTLDKDATLIYSWKSTGPLAYDFHTEPAGKPKGSSDSFEADEGKEGHGGYVAPYAGIHGWFWENQSPNKVTLTFAVTGFFTSAILYNTDDGTSKSVPISPPGPDGRPRAKP